MVIGANSYKNRYWEGPQYEGLRLQYCPHNILHSCQFFCHHDFLTSSTSPPVFHFRYSFQSHHETRRICLDCSPYVLIRSYLLRICICPQLPLVDCDAYFPWSSWRWFIGEYYLCTRCIKPVLIMIVVCSCIFIGSCKPLSFNNSPEHFVIVWFSIIDAVSSYYAQDFSSVLHQVLPEPVSPHRFHTATLILTLHLVGGLLASGLLSIKDFGEVKGWRKVATYKNFHAGNALTKIGDARVDFLRWR